MAPKKKKLEVGTVYQQKENGNYYFRFQIDGRRKSVSLGTNVLKEAIKEARQNHIPQIKSKNLKALVATTEHVKHAKGFGKQIQSLSLSEAWAVYSKHPDRATPATVSEKQSYQTTFQQFVNSVKDASTLIKDVTYEMAENFSAFLKESQIAVDTHNRKIRRLRKIFDVLSDYRSDANPFVAPALRRKEREEQDNIVRRLSFTRGQEESILKVLDDDSHKVLNKAEIKVVYYLGMFTGQRFKDCVLLRWDKVSFQRKRIWVKQFKTGKEVTIPIAPELMKVLNKARKSQRNHYVCPNLAERYKQKDKNGKNTGNGLVNNDIMRVIKWIGLEPSVKIDGRKKKVVVYGFHSLRHSFASHCAEAGVPKAVVLSILGTNSEIVDKHYTHIGDEAQEKAIQAISGSISQITDKERIDKALRLIDSLPNKTNLIKQIEARLRS